MAGRNLFAQAHQQVNRVHHHLGSSPLICWFLGALSLLLWACGTVVQIQTSEYLALGNNTRVAGVAWGILLQPWLMLTGQAPAQYVTAWMYGWTVEVVTLIFALTLSVAVAKISLANPKLGKGFLIFGFLLIALNSWADYSSSPGTTPLVQGLIALAIALMVVCGLPIAVGLLEHGFEEL
jgi:hypothetical protein